MLCEVLKENGLVASVANRPLQYWDVPSASRKVSSISAIFIDNQVVSLGTEEGWRGWVMYSFKGSIPRQAKWCEDGIDISEVMAEALKAHRVSGQFAGGAVDQAQQWMETYCQAALLQMRTINSSATTLRRGL